ncbi:MAG: hypothetical protein HZB40_21645 [Rhodocyclales bacterium]|nr:hypothetical protein [Rhodocyclales bacterium]
MSSEEATTKLDGGASVSTAGLGLRRMGRAVWWLAINGTFGVLLWFGLVEGVEGARNLGLFMAWVSAVVSLFVFTDSVQAEMTKNGRSVPRPIGVASDLAILGLLIWFGAWVTGAAYAFGFVMQEAGWEAAGKSRPNVQVTGAARLHRAASSDRRERG